MIWVVATCQVFHRWRIDLVAIPMYRISDPSRMAKYKPGRSGKHLVRSLNATEGNARTRWVNAAVSITPFATR